MIAVVDLYVTQIVEPGKQGLFFLFLGFILTFLFIRFSVRMIRAGVSWWPGNVSSGDVHVHHVVFGMVAMFVAGLLAFAPAGWESPWWEILGALFGIGAALVLDEFALILHLEDVYWSEQGRKSVDAVGPRPPPSSGCWRSVRCRSAWTPSTRRTPSGAGRSS